MERDEIVLRLASIYSTQLQIARADMHTAKNLMFQWRRELRERPSSEARRHLQASENAFAISHRNAEYYRELLADLSGPVGEMRADLEETDAP